MINDYDTFADAYTTDNEHNLINGHYARPAMVDLAGEVTGRRILDAGCGSGALAAKLRENGAIVSGFDSSARMVELARDRLGPDTDLRVGDLGAPLPYADAAFDDVVAALVLHYLEDWSGALAELRRVLRPGGRLIVSVNHPLLYPLVQPKAGYFPIKQWSDDYVMDGQPVVLTYWHRPLHAMSDAFTAAGFRIAVISEPAPTPDSAELFPDEMAKFPSGKFLSFLFFALEAV